MKSQPVTIPDDLFLDAKRGDADAVTRLWTVCEPLIAEGLRRHPTSSVPTLSASDVAQEAARIFLEAVHGDDVPSIASFIQFLASKLPYRLQSYVRAERRRLGRQVIPGDALLERAVTLGRRHAESGGPPGRRIARAMERLSPRQRAVIAGLYFREDSLRGIADELGISYKAVSAVHGRALKILRDALADLDSPPPLRVMLTPADEREEDSDFCD
ncbi:MAG: sigma-70 family RNA polymerase sigma factor [Chloroflexota bacterium]